MNTIYKNYIDKYGNFSHILNFEIDEKLSENDKKIILSNIYDLINEKDIEKNISETYIRVKWRVYDEKDLLHYYTDGYSILSDKGFYEHTKLLLNDIKKIKNSDKINIILTKPITKSICIM